MCSGTPKLITAVSNTSHILAHMLGLAASRRPRVNQDTNMGLKWNPSTNLHIEENMSSQTEEGRQRAIRQQ